MRDAPRPRSRRLGLPRAPPGVRSPGLDYRRADHKDRAFLYLYIYLPTYAASLAGDGLPLIATGGEYLIKI